MYKLIIKRADESVYWVEHFDTEEQLQDWLAKEQTRPYWDDTFEPEVEEIVTQGLVQPTEWDLVRVRRDNALASSDWTQLIDAPFTANQKQEWRNYRQALRDVPQQSGDPDNIVWPEAPEYE